MVRLFQQFLEFTLGVSHKPEQIFERRGGDRQFGRVLRFRVKPRLRLIDGGKASRHGR